MAVREGRKFTGARSWLTYRGGVGMLFWALHRPLMRDVGDEVTFEPLMGFRVLKDLIGELDGFFETVRSVKAFQITESPPLEKERIQSPEAYERYEESSKCIMCGACTGSCPVDIPVTKAIGEVKKVIVEGEA